VRRQQLPQPDKGPHHKDAHLNGFGGIQNRSGHDSSMLSE